jgi:hypothetical protein
MSLGRKDSAESLWLSEPEVFCLDCHLDLCPSLKTCLSYLRHLQGFVVIAFKEVVFFLNWV